MVGLLSSPIAFTAHRRRRPWRGAPIALPDIAVNGNERLPVAMEELSRVLGGGIVPGSVVLVGGDPGIGKSTSCCVGSHDEHGLDARALRIRRRIRAAGQMRAARLGIRSSQLYILAENSLEQILLHLRRCAPAWPSWIRSTIHMEGWRPPRQRQPGARCANAMRTPKAVRSRACHQTGAMAHGCWSTSSIRCSPRGSASHLPAAPQRQELLAPPTRWACSSARRWHGEVSNPRRSFGRAPGTPPARPWQ